MKDIQLGISLIWNGEFPLLKFSYFNRIVDLIDTGLDKQ